MGVWLIYFKGLIGNPTLSPVFLAFVASIFISLHKLNFKSFSIKGYYACYFLMFLLSVVLIFLQYYFFDLKFGVLNEMVRIAFPWLFSVLFHFAFINSADRAWKLFYSYSVILFISSVLRVISTIASGNIQFYDFKYDSFLFLDSNFEGFVAFCILLLSFDFKFNSNRRNSLNFILLTVCLLSFSRAIWIALFFYASIRGFFKLSFRAKIIVQALLLLPIYYLIELYLDDITSDGSLLTKVDIITNIFGEYISQSSAFSLLIGIGSGGMIDLFDRESHNLFGLTVELGLIYMPIYTIVFFTLVYRVTNHLVAFSILFPSLISLFPIAYTTSLLVFVLCLKYNNNQTISSMKSSL